MSARGAAAADGAPVEAGDMTEEGGYRATVRLLARADRPTAVFAVNDMTAVGVLSAAEELGLRVPRDLSVVGYDDTSISRLRHVWLTTVDGAGREVGRRAARCLLDRLEQPGERGACTWPHRPWRSGGRRRLRRRTDRVRPAWHPGRTGRYDGSARLAGRAGPGDRGAHGGRHRGGGPAAPAGHARGAALRRGLRRGPGELDGRRAHPVRAQLTGQPPLRRHLAAGHGPRLRARARLRPLHRRARPAPSRGRAAHPRRGVAVGRGRAAHGPGARGRGLGLVAA